MGQKKLREREREVRIAFVKCD